MSAEINSGTPLSFQPADGAEGGVQVRGQREAGKEQLQGAVCLHLQVGEPPLPTSQPLPLPPGAQPLEMGWTWWWLCSEGAGEVQAVQVGCAASGCGDHPSTATSVAVSIPDYGLGPKSEHGVSVRHGPVSRECDVPYPVRSAAGKLRYR